ncbi:mismatched base pair and cruciform dna recognition [Fusarium acutatum]|uniref:Mismatched base pair and cruciform dna recognition n=1 Tax=Fusarium acutatum TaxID=78861 RepID=A0A8H4JWK9_9HYPO|nr:mismatched base pair and cruciform dna recognition [Fusarium acutatum]
MSDTPQPSTLKSVVDSASGAVQSAIGSLTGNTSDQAAGDLKKQKAEAEHDASHATAKLPGATLSGSGAAAKDDPNRTEGSWNQTAGSAKEAVGGIIGSESLKKAGHEQNLEGRNQEAKGQLSDLGTGISNRVQGTVGGAVSNLTGNKEQEAHYDELRAEGKTRQRGVEHDIQKKAEAESRE